MNAQRVIGRASGPLSGPMKREAEMEARLRRVIEGGPAAIAERLGQLDREWTAGRATKATAGVLIVAGLGLALAGSALGLPESLWALALPIVGGAILVQYVFTRTSLVGEFYRWAGLRPGAEIEQEKLALRALRGDFQHLPTVHQIEDREDLSRMEGEGGFAVEPDESKVDATAAVRELMGAARR